MKNDELFGAREPGRATADFEAFWNDVDDLPASLGEGAPGSPITPASPNRVYDLEERTARFGEAVIAFAKRLPFGPVNNRLIDQIVGAATSVGANYCEADDAVSKKEFIVNINRCRKEARETKFFLRMVAAAEPSLKAEARVLWREAKELNLIFSSIVRKARGNSNDENRMANDEPEPKPRSQPKYRKGSPTKS